MISISHSFKRIKEKRTVKNWLALVDNLKHKLNIKKNKIKDPERKKPQEGESKSFSDSQTEEEITAE